MKAKMAVCMIMLMSYGSAYALEAIQGKVTVLEGTYMPGTVTFQLDTGDATCPAGTWLVWQKADLANNKAIYATLMAALIAGRQITFVINDGDTSCTGQFLHLLDN
ncbi:MAG: hypothetical protein P8173_16370 [Gammaproteobacteria bacterium]|jgi:hypothetical protein